MRIVFINPSLRPEAKRRQLPVGLGYILTAVKKAGFDFDLIDMDIDNLSMRHLEESLAEGSYDVIALGCIVTGFRV
jgi:anaerobic magnesium-protoporphyrin IX monomethyl ester cyclase